MRILIIAGPNGAGKTTFAREYLPKEANCLTFINADLIAAGLEPFQPEKAAIHASRLMLYEIESHVRTRENFAFETTLSGLAYAHRIKEWRSIGYHVRLVFLSLPNADMAVERVAIRVTQGGHNIPEETIRRRYIRGLHNFHTIYQSLVDDWILYDNSGPVTRLVDSGDKQ